jgi:DNA-binding response OmpR family regulator
MRHGFHRIIRKDRKDKIMDPRVYIAEEEEAVQQRLRDSLTRHGFSVTVFDSGYPIVTMMDNWPGVFLIDIELPGINGLEVCKWLKSHEGSRHIPVILIFSDPYLKVLANSTGADDFIEKPVVMKEVISRVKNCLVTSHL